MSLQTDLLEEYLEQHSSQEPTELRRLRREAHVHLLQPRMLSGHLQGRLLKMLVQLINPHNVLELGTYTAYASLCLAEGLQNPSARVHTIEHNDEMEDFIHRSLALSPFGDRVVVHIGDALEVMQELLSQHPFDLVYIDADKRHYPSYYQLLIPALPSQALILADNTLWDGKVLQS
ncbi:O-methyltransferase, partial [Porphyromonas endodontalis]